MKAQVSMSKVKPIFWITFIAATVLFASVFTTVKVRAALIGSSQPEDSSTNLSGNDLIISDTNGPGSFYSPESWSYLYVPTGPGTTRVSITKLVSETSGQATIREFTAYKTYADTSTNPLERPGECNDTSVITSKSNITSFANSTTAWTYQPPSNAFLDIPDTAQTGTGTVHNGTTEFSIFCIKAETYDDGSTVNPGGNNSYKHVSFRLGVDNSAKLGNYPGADTSRGTGYYNAIANLGVPGNSQPAGTWTKTLEFSSQCETTKPGDWVTLYDLDTDVGVNSGLEFAIFEGDKGGSYSATPMALEERGGWAMTNNGGNWYHPVNALTNTAVNVKPSGSQFNMYKKYKLEVRGIGRLNKIRLRIPYTQILTDNECPKAQCDILQVQTTAGSSTIYPGDPIRFQVRVRYAAGFRIGVNGPTWGAELPGPPATNIGNYLVTGAQYARGPTAANNDTTFWVQDIAYSDAGALDQPMNAPATIGVVNNYDWGLVQPGVGWNAETCDGSFTVTDPNEPPDITKFEATCAVNKGQATAVITITYSLEDEDGDTMTLTFTGPRAHPNSTSTQSYSYSHADVTDQTQTITVTRSSSTYSITGINLNDGTDDDPSPPADLTGISCPLPLDPDVTVDAYDCTTLEFTIEDDDEGFAYTVYLEEDNDLGGSGGWSAETNTSVTADGSGDFNTRVSNHRDFTTHRFRLRAVNNTFNTVATNTAAGDIDIGPCMEMECTSASTPTNPVEINRSFTVTVNLATKYSASGLTGPIGQFGRTLGYDLDVTVTPPGTTNSISGTLNANQPPSGLFSHSVGDFQAPSDEGPGTISYSVTGTSGSVSGAGDCGDTSTVTFAAIPYFQSFRGDVIAGYGMKDSSGLCTIPPGINGDIITRIGYQVAGADSDGDGNPDIVGAGTQTAVFARGAVNNFRSSITQSNQNSSPWLNIFANEGVTTVDASASSNLLGGNFDTSLCAEDWFYDEPDAYINDPDGDGKIDVSSIRGLVGYNGPIEMSYSSPLEGNRKIFVNGDVIIGSSDVADTGTHAYVYNTTGWESIYDIPVAVIVATGNIYIDDNVSILDAILVAQGTVFTCAPTQNGLPTDAQEVTDGTNTTAPFIAGGGCYDRPLSLHGAIISNSVRLWRTGGTLSEQFNGAVTPSTGYQTYGDGRTQAETFRLPAEVYLAPRFGEASLNGSQGKKQLDSLISLPPQF